MRAAIAAAMVAGSLMAGETYGPFEADLVRVIDGDTVVLAIHVWPGVTQVISIREDGVDTPERRSSQACERDMAGRATDFTSEFLHGAITVDGIRNGKYAGRVLGSVHANGRRLSEALIEAGLGRRYDGGKREEWCNDRVE